LIHYWNVFNWFNNECNVSILLDSIMNENLIMNPMFPKEFTIQCNVSKHSLLTNEWKSIMKINNECFHTKRIQFTNEWKELTNECFLPKELTNEWKSILEKEFNVFNWINFTFIIH